MVYAAQRARCLMNPDQSLSPASAGGWLCLDVTVLRLIA